MKNKQNNRAHTASVQTARATSPYKVLDRYVPLSKPEFAVYDAIREAVPMVDAAILKIVRLVDNFNISCSDIKVEKELKEFCDKMIQEEEEYVVLKKNAGVFQENIKFPVEYRDNLNKLLLKQINKSPEGLLKVHSNSSFNFNLESEED